MEATRGVACNILHKEVDRDKSSQYYVSEKQYPDKYYPPYCASYFMLRHRGSLEELLTNYFEDISDQSIHMFTVYLGVLAQKVDTHNIEGKAV